MPEGFEKNITLYSHTNNNGGWGNAKIILIEKFCLNDKSELIREEDRYIQANFDSPFCLNMKFYNKSLQRDVTKTTIDNTDNKEYNKYNNSKIYRLFSDDGYFYYGSTSENIKERLRNHIKTSKMPVYRDSKVYKYFNEFGWNNVKIETVSEHLFETKKQLKDEKNKYIDKYVNDPKCLNTRRSVMFDEERRKTKTETESCLWKDTKKKLWNTIQCTEMKIGKIFGEKTKKRSTVFVVLPYRMQV